MPDHATFCGTYSDWKLIRTRSVVQIIFEVPLEASGDAYQVLGGMPQPSSEVWCAIARLDMKGGEANQQSKPGLQPDKPAPASVTDLPVRARKPVAAEKRFAQQAGICCGDPVFQQFLYEHDMVIEKTEDCAVTAVYLICGVATRKDIVPGSAAADAWDRLYSKFMAWKIAA